MQRERFGLEEKPPPYSQDLQMLSAVSTGSILDSQVQGPALCMYMYMYIAVVIGISIVIARLPNGTLLFV